jgi:hypothetical protein
MDENIVIVMEDFILFSSSINAVNTSNIEIPLEYFLSDYGLIIPISLKSLTPFSVKGKLFHNRSEDVDMIELIDRDNLKENCHSLLLTRNGKFFTITNYNIETDKFYMNYLPSGKGIKWALATESMRHDTTYSAIHLCDTIDKAFKVFCDMVPNVIQTSCKIYRISELVQWIDTCLGAGDIIPFEGTIITPSSNIEVVENALHAKSC